ncbi:MAG: outer membrane beta-barrel protein [Desulfovibrio sp.]|jgi:opacity protein-like surface antigen|nr:outer membrane beta-barrel protein [Desulfovibrio sp.]
MFKRIFLGMALIVVLAAPAAAEVKGIYGGLKFIDSIQNTGSMSKGDDAKGFGIGQYGQNTVGGGVFLGYDFFPVLDVPVRAEVEYAVRTNMNTTWDRSFTDGVNTAKSEIEAQWNLQTLFFNAYWDFHNSTAFTPYIGAGIGVGFINSSYDVSGYLNGQKLGSVSESKQNSVFAWNAGIGCSYAFNENVSADLAYRFVGLGYYEPADGLGMSPYANEFSLGLRFTF